MTNDRGLCTRKGIDLYLNKAISTNELVFFSGSNGQESNILALKDGATLAFCENIFFVT